jgi:tRNA threonylcarbamoyladenosine biosynthesis protein TsaE
MDRARTTLLTGAGETRALGERLGRLLHPGDWIALRGDLGAGKTTLVSGIVEGIHPGMRSRSPTYVRVEVYGRSPAIVHADLYRLESPEEWDTLGLEDLAEGAIVVVEWADRARDRLPEERLDLALEYAGAEARSVRFEPHGARWKRLLGEGGFEAA